MNAVWEGVAKLAGFRKGAAPQRLEHLSSRLFDKILPFPVAHPAGQGTQNKNPPG